MRSAKPLALPAAVGFLLMAQSARAQTTGTLDGIVTSFQTISTGWEGPLRTYALGTFGLLSLISLALAGFKLAFRNADLSEWLAELVNQILYLGFFLLLLENSVTYGGLIIQSFRSAAASAGGGPLSPTGVMNAGITIAQEILNQMSLAHPGRDVMLALGGLGIVVVYALITAEMIVTLVSSYIVIAASVIFMAFGGLAFTKEIAISVLRYTFSVGAKLFILQLLISVGQGFILQWTTQFTVFTVQSFCTVIGCSAILFVLVKQIPTEIQGIVNGSHHVGGSGGLIGAAAFVAGTAVAVTANAAGAPVAIAQAARLAASQGAEKAAGGQSKGIGARAFGMAAGTGANLAKAAGADVGRRLSGQSTGRGSASWRMAADMGNKRRLLDEDNEGPKPPNNNPPNTIS